MTTTGERPTVFLLHGLGLSCHLYDAVVEHLGETVDAVSVDLPGFGGSAALPGVGVEAMADHVIDLIAHRAGPRWLLVGHSLGGKVASVVAARTLSGTAPVFGLAGVVLLAASPPSPEPIDDDMRAEMLAWAADGPLDATDARAYVDGNVGAALPPDLDALALTAVRRASPEAWRAWLTRGSREDWSDRVGVLDVPAAILAGGDDPALGEEAQRRLNGPVYPRARVQVLAGARHLLPLERPAEVAAAITDLWRDRAGLGPTPPADLTALLASDRVSARTRAALASRAVADDPDHAPAALDAPQLRTLRTIADRVVPQGDGGWIDLAARVDAELARGDGDGWRFADLPPDVEAFRAALTALAPITGLEAAGQDGLLTEVADGTGPATDALSSAQLARWFEDARTALVRQWLGHPATMARIGYDGFATGGDGARQTGFQLVGADERERWEPLRGVSS